MHQNLWLQTIKLPLMFQTLSWNILLSLSTNYKLYKLKKFKGLSKHIISSHLMQIQTSPLFVSSPDMIQSSSGTMIMDNHRKRSRDDQFQPETSSKRPVPSFYTVIRGAMMAEAIKGICKSLEPMIRKVIHEEVQQAVCGPNPLYGNRLYFLEQPVPVPQSQPSNEEEIPRHKLVFEKQVRKPVYTSNNITDTESYQLKIKLVDINTGEICKNMEGSPIKVKLVVIDGELEPEGFDSEKFSSKIVKEREGKRPLLVGNTEITLNGGVGVVGDISFTDNTKWIRCGTVRLGAFVDSERRGTVLKIQEGLTEKFKVKDHRGQSYEKHDIPMLDDEVWRLMSIAKDGKYHFRLKEKNINSVQDFLKIMNTNPDELKEILKMPTKAWNKVVKHAQTCPNWLNITNLGNNPYLPTWHEETQTGAYGNGGESGVEANPIIMVPGSSSFNQIDSEWTIPYCDGFSSSPFPFPF